MNDLDNLKKSKLHRRTNRNSIPSIALHLVLTSLSALPERKIVSASAKTDFPAVFEIRVSV